jgi:hypothetical protein
MLRRVYGNDAAAIVLMAQPIQPANNAASETKQQYRADCLLFMAQNVALAKCDAFVYGSMSPEMRVIFHVGDTGSYVSRPRASIFPLLTERFGAVTDADLAKNSAACAVPYDPSTESFMAHRQRHETAHAFAAAHGHAIGPASKKQLFFNSLPPSFDVDKIDWDKANMHAASTAASWALMMTFFEQRQTLHPPTAASAGFGLAGVPAGAHGTPVSRAEYDRVCDALAALERRVDRAAQRGAGHASTSPPRGRAGGGGAGGGGGGRARGGRERAASPADGLQYCASHGRGTHSSRGCEQRPYPKHADHITPDNRHKFPGSALNRVYERGVQAWTA